MATKTTRLCMVLACVLATACEAEVKIGDLDGSLFADSGNDANIDEDAEVPETDAATADTGTVDGGDAGMASPAREAIQALADGICGALVACEGEQVVRDALDGESCASLTGSVLEGRFLEAIEASVADGRITLDPTRFSVCVTQLRNQQCDVQSQRRPAACEESIHGNVALGGDCTINEDCAGATTFCKANAACPGTCTALLNADEPCTSSDQCASGLQCSAIDGVKQCVAPGGASAECDRDGLLPPCKRGLRCELDGADYLCRYTSLIYIRQSGQSCDRAARELCDNGLACTATPAGQVCNPIAPIDGACFRAEPNHCPEGQYCDAEVGVAGTCRDLPEDGEPCIDRAQACAQGYTCVVGVGSSPDTCEAIGPNGGACTVSDECYSGNCSGVVCEAPASICSL